MKKIISFISFFYVLNGTLFAQLDLDFNIKRGFYSTAQLITLSSPEPGVTIKYTTNGKTPSQTLGSVYTGPININTTTVVKAIAYNSTESSDVEAHTYIFVQDVINQASTTSNFPTSIGLSTSIKSDNTYGPLLDESLQSIPFISFSLDLADYNFIYNTKGVSKQAYVEFYDDSNGDTYGRPVGVSTYGNTSFSASNANKKNYRFRFKEEFGASKFKFDIFGDGAAAEFDVFDLRAGSQETIDRGGIQNIHEKFLKDIQIQTSGEGVHGRFLHVFINGVYWGVYTASERPTKSFGESYYGGNKDDYNTLKATCCTSAPAPIDGTLTSYNQLISNINNYPAVEANLDVDHFIDYVMICNYGPHGDWRWWNTYAFDNPVAGVPLKFFVWDVEPSLKNDWYYTDIIVDTKDFEDIWQPLKSKIDFRMRVADHFECNCEDPDGPLNPSNMEAYYDELFQANKLAYLAEAARWGNKSLYTQFLNYRDNLLNTNWFSTRMSDMKSAYQNENLYPTIKSVQLSQDGGIVHSGFQLSLTNPNSNGTIYYTIDGTDPRDPGGSVAATAQNYSSPVVLPDGAFDVKARVKVGSQWSAMCPKRFYVNQQYQNLVINEIHYNPYDVIVLPDTISGKNFEFIEIKNCGNEEINLIDVELTKGIALTIKEDIIIQPNQFVVFADDREWFNHQYGFYPDGEYIGQLEDSGEKLWLIDPIDDIIDSLRYNDKVPWPATADKGFFSAALKECSTDNALGNNWSIQSVFTTPREENVFTNFGVHGFSGLVINEIHYNPKDSINNQVSPPDTIDGTKYEFLELKNISPAVIDLSGMVFTRGISYQFSNGVSLDPGDFIVLAEDKSSFEDRYGFQPFDKYDGKLSNSGETIWLSNANGVLLDAITYASSFPWDSQANGGVNDYSLALIDGDVDNDTRLNWKVQCNQLYTPGAENDFVCFSGLNYDGLIFNEIHYSPSQGLYYEYIEIINHSNSVLNLESVALAQGVFYVFEEQYLPGRAAYPHNYIVLAKDSTRYHNTYGHAPDGVYVGGLNNSGEKLVLQDLFGKVIDELTYDDLPPWNPMAKQGSHSLALIDGFMDNSLAESWCIQDVMLTPGTANTFDDGDNDSIIDCLDSCPNFNNDLIGNACSDGDPCTVGETYDASCGCTGGQFQDQDSDGVCDATDTCPNFDDNLIGSTCNDGDPCTSGETYDASCGCTGGQFQDQDSDGVCDATDTCPNFDDNLIGSACNDGDPCTSGETYDASCGCTGGQFQDQDSDGVCDATDNCPNFDDNLIGSACNDGDPCTVGETYDTSCGCTGGQVQDQDSDGVCDENDLCPGYDDSIDNDNNGIPDGCQDCVDAILESTNSNIVENASAVLYIKTNGRVTAGNQIEYSAGQSIELENDFIVELGAVFHAFISACDN